MTLGRLVAGLLIVIITLSSEALAQQQQRQMAVEVLHTGTDTVGQRVVFYFKEAIRQSSSLTLALSETHGFKMRFISRDNPGTREGSQTVIAATLTFFDPKSGVDFFMNTRLQFCGADRAKECAERILIDTSNEFERMQRAYESTQKQ
jgi:hypothetical protein